VAKAPFMTASIDAAALITHYFEIWHLPSDARRQAIARAFADDAYYCDGAAEASGHDGIAAMMEGVMTQFPGATLRLTSPVDAHHRQARFAWAMNGADGKPIVDGIDVVRFTPEGKLESILGFFGVDVPSPSSQTTPHRFVWTRRYPVSAARLFEVVSNNALYAQLAPNLTEIRTVSGQGVGMVRECTDTEGACWRETYTAWEPGRRFATKVDASTYPPGLKAMITALDASWTVSPGSENESSIEFVIEAVLTDLGVQVLRDGGGADALITPIFDGWSAHLQQPTRR